MTKSNPESSYRHAELEIMAIHRMDAIHIFYHRVNAVSEVIHSANYTMLLYDNYTASPLASLLYCLNSGVCYSFFIRLLNVLFQGVLSVANFLLAGSLYIGIIILIIWICAYFKFHNNCVQKIV